ncbi:S8 family serine peptidase [Nannocystis pusilla]|uniref:S8 family serine peptidase n=1 Tax=Nannocystis pusilla TaxID=889268 RepID=UPI003DA51EDD
MLLWSGVRRAVTKDGVTLTGEEIKRWLVARSFAVAGGDDVRITMADDVVLRTKEEMRALLEALECKEHAIADDPRALVGPRHGGRGTGVRNHNDGGVVVEFLAETGDTQILTTRVEHGKTARIRVRMRPAPAGVPLRLELAFIGAKLRSRPATRSVLAPSSGYRYLSRVRVARHVDGIRDPVPELTRGVLNVAIAARDDVAASATVSELTLLGLEPGHGSELLQACLFDRDDRLIASKVLRVDIDAEASLGALRVLDCEAVDHYVNGADAEFAAIYALASSPTPDAVRVGICDTGIFDDSAGANYLASRVVEGRFFGTPLPESVDAPRLDREDQPTRAGDGREHILVANPSKHGTNVASQAAWGTAKIKLVDTMVQKGQMAGSITPVTAARAFTWAIAQGVSVVNCSKILPFNTDALHDVVRGARDRVLFLATGGNDAFFFQLGGPLAVSERNKYKLIGPDELPRSFENTLWVGGCNRSRTPHESRGYGPAIDVMIPSDKPKIYTPLVLTEASRSAQLRRFRLDLLAGIDAHRATLDERIPPLGNKLEYERLIATSRQLAAKGQALSDEDRLALEAFEADRPNWRLNPQPGELTTAKATIEGWATDDMQAWFEELLTMRNAGKTRPVVKSVIESRIRSMDIEPAYEELRAARAAGNDMATDDGVSFGLPIVANVAAKLKLIRGDLTPNELKRILIDTSDRDPGFENQCIAKGIVNPLRAYLAAFDRDVSTGGRDPHEVVPAPSPRVPEARRVYYSLFHMGPDGLRLYDAIKAELKSTYLALNIDLIEAEPPIEIPSEPLTNVAGRAIKGYNWNTLVPVNHSGLAYAPHHLRLILVNECALSLGNPMSGAGVTHSFVWKTAPAPAWTLKPGPDRATMREATGAGAEWRCTLTLPETRVFAPRVDQALTRATASGLELSEDRITAVSTDPRTLQVTLRFDTEEIRRDTEEIELELGIYEPLGGNASGRNIMINSKYHGGAGGTAEANRSALVLFQHEIGHALGMVPETHTEHYDDALGGKGHHCASNTNPIAKADAWSRFGIKPDGQTHVNVPAMLAVRGMGGDLYRPCVMYHTRSSVHHRQVFCDECRDWLRNRLDARTWRWSSD